MSVSKCKDRGLFLLLTHCRRRSAQLHCHCYFGHAATTMMAMRSSTITTSIPGGGKVGWDGQTGRASKSQPVRKAAYEQATPHYYDHWTQHVFWYMFNVEDVCGRKTAHRRNSVTALYLSVKQLMWDRLTEEGREVDTREQTWKREEAHIPQQSFSKTSI